MESFNKRGAFSEIFLPLPITYGAVSLATKEFIKVVHALGGGFVCIAAF